MTRTNATLRLDASELETLLKEFEARLALLELERLPQIRREDFLALCKRALSEITVTHDGAASAAGEFVLVARFRPGDVEILRTAFAALEAECERAGSTHVSEAPCAGDCGSGDSQPTTEGASPFSGTRPGPRKERREAMSTHLETVVVGVDVQGGTLPRDLPPQAHAAMKAIRENAPEYELPFARFLVERVCGLTWLDSEGSDPSEPQSTPTGPDPKA